MQGIPRFVLLGGLHAAVQAPVEALPTNPEASGDFTGIISFLWEIFFFFLFFTLFILIFLRPDFFGCHGTCSVGLASHELTEIHLLSTPECWD